MENILKTLKRERELVLQKHSIAAIEQMEKVSIRMLLCASSVANFSPNFLLIRSTLFFPNTLRILPPSSSISQNRKIAKSHNRTSVVCYSNSSTRGESHLLNARA